MIRLSFNCCTALIRGFIFVFHEEHRRYQEYPEILSSNVKILQTKILIYIAIDMTPTRAKNDGFALNKVKNGPNST